MAKSQRSPRSGKLNYVGAQCTLFQLLDDDFLEVVVVSVSLLTHVGRKCQVIGIAFSPRGDCLADDFVEVFVSLESSQGVACPHCEYSHEELSAVHMHSLVAVHRLLAVIELEALFSLLVSFFAEPNPSGFCSLKHHSESICVSKECPKGVFDPRDGDYIAILLGPNLDFL
jgi:hypothetical protein